MKSRQYLSRLYKLVSLIPSLLLAFALSQPVHAESEQEISQNIVETMDRLLLLLEQNKAQYSKDSDLFYHDLNQELSKVIDFKRIAMKVMGKHGRKASKQERIAFVDVFKRSLYKTYANALLDSGKVSVKALGTHINTRNAKKAKMDLEITNASGSAYAVSYSLHKGKDQVYRVENIVVMGINMGLAFREYFQQQMKLHRGDIQAVIDNWSSEGVA